MKKLQSFSFNEHDVRTVEKDNQVWFVLKDVCEVLELSNARMVKERLSDDVSSTYPIPDALGRQQETTIINEDGLYDVILESRKPEARAFRKWVTGEVLPTIRKHGAYMTSETLEKALASPDFLIQLAGKLKEEQQARIAAEQAKQIAEVQLTEQRPKVIFAEALETSGNSILIGELAKLLRQNGINIGQNRLFDRLRNEGYLMRTKGERWNDPTQRSMDMGLLEIKKRTINAPDGSVKTIKTTKVTGKGQIYFINKFKGLESSGT